MREVPGSIPGSGLIFFAFFGFVLGRPITEGAIIPYMVLVLEAFQRCMSQVRLIRSFVSIINN
ncbi:hypothetical protein ASPVEDRAFT_237764 [Aspergillus versicolor CBS 583.65]|uniref:Uncharacterized protein n=1 Tax=Aspergillus versicolor CBS 583.65 TaxID=1036611 RepID=A0A1L9P4H4_ASPVE|nr:uncharacterized protein ASPVEDRAFT_237764 [Aspergillus versicolor CBS 583.65]OJI96427.1 hypothetical protein ASPVEDRAFT_237764 [Aspergillus versicolor CBS 583.65]